MNCLCSTFYIRYIKVRKIIIMIGSKCQFYKFSTSPQRVQINSRSFLPSQEDIFFQVLSWQKCRCQCLLSFVVDSNITTACLFLGNY